MFKFDEKLYVQFSGIERARLAIAAMSRGDEEEVARLRRTCPILEYRSIDSTYIRAIENVINIVGRFLLICESNCNKVLLLRMGVDAYVMNYKPPEFNYNKEFEEQVKSLQDMQLFLEFTSDMKKNIISHLSYIKSAYTALEQFCIEIDINYHHVSKWLGIPDIEDLSVGPDRILLVNLESDKELSDTIKNMFVEQWSMGI